MTKIIREKLGDQFDAFIEKQTLLMKSRVQLLCSLSVSIYFFATLINMVINPEEFRGIEIMGGLILIVGGIIILYSTRKSRTLLAAKINAYFFIILLLSILSRLGVYYVQTGMDSASLYVFVLFLVSMTIPWWPVDIIPIWLLHVLAFAGQFYYVTNYVKAPSTNFNVRQYIDGVIFLSMALWLCFVVRKRETEREIEDFLLLREVERKNAQMEHELKWATKVHKSIIPKSTSTEKADIAVNYLPVYYIGGDYVKFEFLDNDRLIFIMGDVTGHGIPAALLVNRVHAEFERLAKEGKTPGGLLRELNDFIKEDFDGSNMYLTAFCGLVDFKKMKLKYSNYGHPVQYVYSTKKSSVQELMVHTAMLGIPLDEGDKQYEDIIDVATGDKILLFTDGVTETVDATGEEFGPQRIVGFLEENHKLSSRDFNAKLLEHLDAYKSGKYKDDICLLNITITVHSHFFGI